MRIGFPPTRDRRIKRTCSEAVARGMSPLRGWSSTGVCWSRYCTDSSVQSLLGSFIFTTWGVCIVAALDSTVIFFLPFAVDLGVVFLASRHPQLFWFYAILVSLMSLIGVAVTFYIGTRIGEAGLERFISRGKAKRVIERVRNKGAVAIAALDLIPPPFPMTGFILTAGALEVNTIRFFVAMLGFRLIRFGALALLAAVFGTKIIRLIESHTAYVIAEIFTVVVLVGSTISVYHFLRQIRPQCDKPQESRPRSEAA